MKIQIRYLTIYEIDTNKLEKDWEQYILEGGHHDYCEKPKTPQEWIDYCYEIDSMDFLDCISDSKIIDTF